MAATRLLGKVLLNGSARKQLSNAVYQEYTQARKVVNKAGLLKGLNAELKVKGGSGLFGQKSEEYIQLAYKDSKNKTQKFALGKRVAGTSVEDYLKEAIEKAKTMTGDLVKSGMAKSKNYEQYIASLKNNQSLYGNLPENATVTFKRSALTGHKKVKIAVPAVNAEGKAVSLKQTLKKEKGGDINAFVKESLEHTNLVFENDINLRGIKSARQIQERVKKVLDENTNNALKGLKRDWTPTLNQSAYLANQAPTNREVFNRAVNRIEDLRAKTLQDAQKRVARQQKFRFVNEEYEQLGSQLAASPSRNKGTINLELEKQRTYDAYKAMKESLQKTYDAQIDRHIQTGRRLLPVAQPTRGQRFRAAVGSVSEAIGNFNQTAGEFFDALHAGG